MPEDPKPAPAPRDPNDDFREADLGDGLKIWWYMPTGEYCLTRDHAAPRLVGYDAARAAAREEAGLPPEPAQPAAQD